MKQSILNNTTEFRLWLNAYCVVPLVNVKHEYSQSLLQLYSKQSQLVVAELNEQKKQTAKSVSKKHNKNMPYNDFEIDKQ